MVGSASVFAHNSETKNQPKEEVFGRTSLWTSGQKLRSGLPSPGKKASWHGHSARTSTKKSFGLKNFGLIFHSPSTRRENPYEPLDIPIRNNIIADTDRPITPNNFWGFNKHNSQAKLHHLVLSLLGRSTPRLHPKYSQRINWRNKFTSVTPKNSRRINCVILMGPMVLLGLPIPTLEISEKVPWSSNYRYRR